MYLLVVLMRPLLQMLFLHCAVRPVSICCFRLESDELIYCASPYHGLLKKSCVADIENVGFDVYSAVVFGCCYLLWKDTLSLK